MYYDVKIQEKFDIKFFYSNLFVNFYLCITILFKQQDNLRRITIAPLMQEFILQLMKDKRIHEFSRDAKSVGRE